jgi:hypothetical protein
MEMIKKIKSISKELITKKEIWNKYGANREKHEDQIAKYKWPIEIDEK